MRVSHVKVKNFRLLQDISVCLEDRTTVIVGRNNSGKTSFTELLRRLFQGSVIKFDLEDFSLESHEGFWNAYEKLLLQEADEDLVREALPEIVVELKITYEQDDPNFNVLSEFIVDLNETYSEARIKIRYQLSEGQVSALFKGFTKGGNEQRDQKRFYRMLKNRVPELYEVTITAVDPDESEENEREIKLTSLRELIMSDFITAQRGLDDTTDREKDVLGKVLEKLFFTMSSDDADQVSKDLENVVEEIQKELDGEFSNRLKSVLPSLSTFGYPGLGDSGLLTETILDVKKLLHNHTKIRYETERGIGLPETYNGLGSRNLIYMLLQVYQFFKSYQARPTASGTHLIFIEEPEAHLHPQMQEVFVRQINKIADQLSNEDGLQWPVQFVITTHSTHMANEAPFDSIRYFMSKRDGKKHTVVKDLRNGFNGEVEQADKEFLHKYMTLTRCDLFFADKAILIEGTTERLLMPKMIQIVDSQAARPKLSSQYISVVEVGGAHAKIFFSLLDYLELRSLIITDLDTVIKAGGVRCQVSKGTRTSNASIKKWFDNPEITPTELLAASDTDKVQGVRRIAFQIPETGSTACGRSFEDAFLLANGRVEGRTDAERAALAMKKAKSLKKTNYALDLAFETDVWTVPRYIKEGLEWLSKDDDRSETEAPVPVL